jgi:hypothetical protein
MYMQPALLEQPIRAAVAEERVEQAPAVAQAAREL